MQRSWDVQKLLIIIKAVQENMRILFKFKREN